MIQLQKRHTASVLKDEILKCLKEFNIDISQVYSNTTDNGANILKASKILQELQEEYINEEIHQPENTTDQDERIHSTLASVFSVVRCAAHTIQLAAHDVLKTIEHSINECRAVVKKIRVIVRGGSCNFQMPVLDNATRWNSTFEMLNSLLKLRDSIENFHGMEDMVINWEFIANFVTAFNPLAQCTKKLQSEQYVIGDFYRDWLSCELELEDLSSSNNFAKLLYNAMRKRKEKLMENDAFLAALYLDPRINFENSVMLTDQQKTMAVDHLVKTYDIIQELESAEALSQFSSDQTSLQDLTAESTAMANIPGTSKDSYARLAQRMQQMIAESPARMTNERSLRQKLTMLADEKMVSLEMNILQYWKNTYDNDNDLKKLVQVALAVPATQVSVERAFSALSVILTKLRNKLSNKTINNILITKLNYSIIESVDLDFLDELY